jgi:NAD(P)H dehydrogenase (quinone)
MNILIVSAHDDEESFVASMHNSALGTLERAGHKISNTILYSQEFNPVTSPLDFSVVSGVHAEYIYEQQRAVNTGTGFSPDIKAEMDKLSGADLIIFHFPLWWGGPPAILKGWLDKVLAMGFAWNTNNKYKEGLMKGKRVLASVAVGDPESYYTSEGQHRATVPQHLFPVLHRTLAYCGFDVHKPFIVHNVTASSDSELDSKLLDYRNFLSQIEQNTDFIYKH